MTKPTISLCTFTYNDHRLVNGLLAGLAEWSVQPDEVLVMDDGSDPPYDPQGLPGNARVLRNGQNQGITAAKHRTISQAKADLVVAMDCDARVGPDWLALTLSHLARPEVGAVSGPVFHDAGQDLVSRFLACRGDNHHLGSSGPVDFLPGNALVFKRRVWEDIEGFSGYDREVCEDHVFSLRARRAGYVLWVEPLAKVAQVRKLSRTAAVMRFWKWYHDAYKKRLVLEEAMPLLAFELLVKPLSERVGPSLEAGEPLFIYLELLYMFHAILDLLRFGQKKWAHTALAQQALLAEFAGFFSEYPRLMHLLRADLGRMGHAWPKTTLAGPRMWEAIFSVLECLKPTGIFTWLAEAGVRKLLADDAALDRDFSFYLASSLDEPGLRA
jgi:GT2 family glycosyltransferase